MAWKWKRKATPRKSREERWKEHIERIAYKVYQNRLLIDRHGDSNSDWETAEKIVRNPWRFLLFTSHCSLIKLEKKIWEPLLNWANNQALLSLLGLIGNVGIIIAVVTYIGSEKQRRDAEVRNAWQTITSAYGQPGSGGRIEALEFLNASPGANWRWRVLPWLCERNQRQTPRVWFICFTWPAESLAGISLAVDSIDETDSEDSEEPSNHSSAGAYLAGAYLYDINLEGAFLRSANLEGANLGSANLEGADLWGANLEGAFLGIANLEGAYLRSANLEGAVLVSANLEGVDLWGANLEGAYLSRANLEGVQNLTEEQLAQAKLCQTILPEHITLDSDRDCEALGTPQ